MHWPPRRSLAAWRSAAAYERWPTQRPRGAASPEPARPQDPLLDGLALLISEGHAAGAPALRQAVSAFRGADIVKEGGLRWLWLAWFAAAVIWDYESWDV